MPSILTAAEAASYRITAIPSSPATIDVAMSAERSVKRLPSRATMPTSVRAAVEAEKYYAAEAKERQKRKPADFVVANLPQQKEEPSKAREQAAAAVQSVARA